MTATKTRQMIQTLDYATAPIGVVVSVQVVRNCPTCAAPFSAENLATLSPSGGLTCGPCIGEEPRR